MRSTQSVEKPVETARALRAKRFFDMELAHSALHDSSVTKGHAFCVFGHGTETRV